MSYFRTAGSFNSNLEKQTRFSPSCPVLAGFKTFKLVAKMFQRTVALLCFAVNWLHCCLWTIRWPVQCRLRGSVSFPAAALFMDVAFCIINDLRRCCAYRTLDWVEGTYISWPHKTSVTGVSKKMTWSTYWSDVNGWLEGNAINAPPGARPMFIFSAAMIISIDESQCSASSIT